MSRRRPQLSLGWLWLTDRLTAMTSHRCVNALCLIFSGAPVFPEAPPQGADERQKGQCHDRGFLFHRFGSIDDRSQRTPSIDVAEASALAGEAPSVSVGQRRAAPSVALPDTWVARLAKGATFEALASPAGAAARYENRRTGTSRPPGSARGAAKCAGVSESATTRRAATQPSAAFGSASSSRSATAVTTAAGACREGERNRRHAGHGDDDRDDQRPDGCGSCVFTHDKLPCGLPAGIRGPY